MHTLLSIFVLSAYVGVGFSQPDRVPRAFPEPLGGLVDAAENQRFGLFRVSGTFEAARMYSGRQKAMLHVLQNRARGALLLIVPLSAVEMRDFEQRIRRRVQQVQAGRPVDLSFLLDVTVHEARMAGEMFEIELTDGTLFTARLLRARSDTLEATTIAGLQMAIADSLIAAVRPTRGRTQQGRFQQSDPNRTRLFLAPTGRRLRQGTGYFADYFLFFPTLAYGFTDFFSAGAGMSLIPGATKQLFYLAPRLAFELAPNAAVAAGMLLMGVPDEGGLSLGYAVGTFGSESEALTLGAGLPLDRDVSRKPVLLIGGELQVGNAMKLIAENWIFTSGSGTAIFSAGVRFWGRRVAADAAIVTSHDLLTDIEGFPFIPWIDFSVFFGKN